MRLTVAAHCEAIVLLLPPPEQRPLVLLDASLKLRFFAETRLARCYLPPISCSRPRSCTDLAAISLSLVTP